MNNMPIGGVEFYLNRREAQYLDSMLTIFSLKEIAAALVMIDKSVQERTGMLYSFMTANCMLKQTLRITQEKGGGIWLNEGAVQHIVAAVTLADPTDMTSDLALEHGELAEVILDRIAPKMTLIENLVGRWPASPLTTKSDKWD